MATGPLAEIPPPGKLSRILGFAIPGVILGALAWTWATRGADAASDGAIFWIAVNSVPAALGAAVALAHPITVLAAFVAAPLHEPDPAHGRRLCDRVRPGRGSAPPRVFELRALKTDALAPRRWFRNRALRIILAFVLPTIGSAIGTFVGGFTADQRRLRIARGVPVRGRSAGRTPSRSARSARSGGERSAADPGGAAALLDAPRHPAPPAHATLPVGCRAPAALGWFPPG